MNSVMYTAAKKAVATNSNSNLT